MLRHHAEHVRRIAASARMVGASDDHDEARERADSATAISVGSMLAVAATGHEPVPFAKRSTLAEKLGHTFVVSGGVSATGAARLAARGALRAGSGLVTLATPRDALAVNAAASTAIMVRAVDTAEEIAAFLADRRLNACVIGPGVGGATTLMMR